MTMLCQMGKSEDPVSNAYQEEKEKRNKVKRCFAKKTRDEGTSATCIPCAPTTTTPCNLAYLVMNFQNILTYLLQALFY